MFQQPATVLWNKKLGPNYFKIGLTCSNYYSAANPGQFIMLRFSGQTDPLLRRPFSIHNLILSNGETEGLELLYKVVGKATAMLARQQPGAVVDI
jgi:dihydroorotate dehydrogenase electron transfer subunit